MPSRQANLWSLNPFAVVWRKLSSACAIGYSIYLARQPICSPCVGRRNAFRLWMMLFGRLSKKLLILPGLLRV